VQPAHFDLMPASYITQVKLLVSPWIATTPA
jgi:hypothetical protein